MTGETMLCSSVRKCATSQKGRLPGWRERSWPRPHKADEDLLQGALACLEVFEVDPELAQLSQSTRRSRPIALVSKV